jgi:hypothetical protein
MKSINPPPDFSGAGFIASVGCMETGGLMRFKLMSIPGPDPEGREESVSLDVVSDSRTSKGRIELKALTESIARAGTDAGTGTTSSPVTCDVLAALVYL